MHLAIFNKLPKLRVASSNLVARSNKIKGLSSKTLQRVSRESSLCRHREGNSLSIRRAHRRASRASPSGDVAPHSPMSEGLLAISLGL
jgi:hypothetical protein